MGFAARIALLFALALSTLGANGNDNPLTGLLQRMSAAAGPVWRTHLISVSRVTLGHQQNVVSTDSEGLRITLRHCSGELCNGTYFDGTHLYAVNMNDTALPETLQPEPFLRALRFVASLQFLSPSFLAQGGRIGDARDVTFAGKRYHTFVVSAVNAVPLRLFVDPDTALVSVAREIGGRETFEYRDYRRVGRFNLPFVVLHDGQLFERYDNRAPVSVPFEPPRGLAPALRGVPQTVSTDSRAVTPIVDCSVGGVAVRCLVDSGNSGISMSSEFASQLGAPVVGTYQVRGLGGYQTQVVRAGPLRIGSATYPEAYYLVLNDLRRYGYDVVLGADVLAGTNVEFDASAHTIRFGAQIAKSRITVPVSFENFIPVIDVGLGTVQASLAVDTGDESNINLAYEFYAKHPGLFSVTQRRSVSGIGGDSVEFIGEIPQVRIGDYHTGPQRIGATQSLAATAFGHVGAAFLQQFVVQLDYAAGQLRLTPRS